MNERVLFLQALEKETPAERSAFLAAACGDDAALRQRVEQLLRSHQDAGSFLGAPAFAAGAEQAEATPSAAGETCTGPVGAGPVNESLSFLTPPMRAGSLGRLGHYEVLEVVGRGGMGIVLRAFDEKLQRVVAIKVMQHEVANSIQARKRFSREARAAAAVVHDHIVPIHAIEESAAVPYLVMQFIEGQSLQQKIDDEGSLDLKEILRIGRQIACGLSAAHKQGLVHRDIKPSNILLENGVQRVKITDFGLARTADDATISQAGAVAGTPQYMSPEQADGRPLDHRSDLFSLGSVLYAMCTGRAPFRAPSTVATLKRVCEDTPRPIPELNPDVPSWLCDIIARLHSKKPEDRFQSAAEVADLLERHLAHLQQPGQAPPPPAPVKLRPARRPARRRWLKMAPLAAPILAGVFVLCYAPSIRLYRANRGELVLDEPRREIEVFRVARRASTDNAWDRWEAKGGSRLSLPPGTYLVEAIGRNGAQAQDWRIDASGAFTFDSTKQHGRQCVVEVKRGDRVRLSVVRWEFAATRDEDRLQGTWVAVSGEYRGMALPSAQFRKRELTVKFSGNDVLMQEKDRSQPLWVTFADGSFRIDPTQTPKSIDIGGKDNTIRFKAVYEFVGHQLRICYDDAPSDHQKRPEGFVTREGTELRTLLLEPQGEPVEAEGFTPLFNGRNLTGWRTHPDQPGDWSVENGLLVGRGPRSYLYSDREFEDFHLRADARINPGGDSGILFRVPFGQFETTDTGKTPLGYQAQISGLDSALPSQRTGNIYGLRTSTKLLAEPAATPNTWIRFEVIAKGNLLTVHVNGVRVAETRDDDGKFRRGAIALEQGMEGSRVQFRKIEIKVLSREEAATSPDVAAPAQPRLLKRFDPAREKPVTPPWADAAKTVTVEDGAWRIENNTNKGNFHVLLATVRDGIPEDGVLICRARVKVKVVSKLAWGDLQLGSASPSFHEYNWPDSESTFHGDVPEWTLREVRYPVHLFLRSDPPAVPIYVGLHDDGVLWVKDLELLHLPAPPAQPRLRRPDETVVRSYTFRDRPIAREELFDSADGWRFSTAEFKRIRLFEINQPELDNCRIILRARLRTAQARGVQLRLIANYPDGALDTIGGRAVVAEGDTNWATYEVALDLKPGERPESLALCLHMEGRKPGDTLSRNQVWVKDVDLLKAPRPRAGK